MKILKSLSVTAALVLAASTAQAAIPLTAKIRLLYGDPSDFVIDTTVTGPCGSTFFHVKRSNFNFKETVTLMVTAFSLNKSIAIYMNPASCEGDRNIITHIGVFQ